MKSEFWQQWDVAVNERSSRTISFWDIEVAILFGVFFTLLRVYYNKIVPQKLRQLKLAEGISTDTTQKLVEEIWLLGQSLVYMFATTIVLQFASGGCTLFSLQNCASQWPFVTPTLLSKQVYNAIVGWYMHCLLKGPLGLGLGQNSDMHFHHCLTIFLLLISIKYNLTQPGLLLYVITNLSNPFLHASKLFNHVQFRTQAKVTFLSFGATFFVSRLVLFPIAVGRMVFVDGYPIARKDNFAIPIYLSIVAGLLALQVLQVQWFFKIVRIIVRGSADEKPVQQAPEAQQPAPTAAKTLQIPPKQDVGAIKQGAERVEGTVDDSAREGRMSIETSRLKGGSISSWVEVGDSSPASAASDGVPLEAKKVA